MFHLFILDMKLFLILSITCMVGVNSFLLDRKPGTEDIDTEITELCAKELNTAADKYRRNADLLEFMGGAADEETTCVVACHFRRLIIQKIAPELTGSSNKETLYNGFNKLIDESFKIGFGGSGHLPIKREDIVEKSATCFAKESTECGFFKCLDAAHPPIYSMALYYYFHGVMRPAFLDDRQEGNHIFD